MKRAPKADIERFLNDVPPAAKQIVRSLRGAVLRLVPECQERVLWGGLSYHRPSLGGPVKGAVCQIVAKGGEVRLDFIHGVRLSDPHRLLRGDRISKRFVPIESTAEAKRPEIADLIREASRLDPRQWA